MAIHMITEILWKGFPKLSSLWTFWCTAAAIIMVGITKWYLMGAQNISERNMHGKVVMITGGTSGIGAAVALRLAQRGAQIILLVHQTSRDIFLVDFIEDLREKSANQLIYAEYVELSSLYSIRQFATKWIDSAPPRRLDMIILCAATMIPPGKPRKFTEEGIDETWMVNYVANFHLLSLLSPAIRAQPPDRDVRIIFITCSSYEKSPPITDGVSLVDQKLSSTSVYAQSKLALNIFALAFQQHLSSYKRPDQAPVNAHVIVVDPGYTRTPGMRRWLTRGTLWGLFVYLLLWHQAWLFLKSVDDAIQSILYATMEAKLGRGRGGKLIKECKEMEFHGTVVKDYKIAKMLWENTEKLIIKVERMQAEKRVFARKKTS